MSLRERTRPGLGIIQPCLASPAKALLVVAGLLWSVSVSSQESIGVFSGNDLYNICNAQSVACAGYVAGMADAFSRDGTLCLPQKRVTTRQLADLVMAYLRDHPETRSFSAASLGHAAFNLAFPCASKPRPPG
jgi:Ssp1 endopeptidase immunity protein Rap1a